MVDVYENALKEAMEKYVAAMAEALDCGVSFADLGDDPAVQAATLLIAYATLQRELAEIAG